MDEWIVRQMDGDHIIDKLMEIYKKKTNKDQTKRNEAVVSKFSACKKMNSVFFHFFKKTSFVFYYNIF